MTTKSRDDAAAPEVPLVGSGNAPASSGPVALAGTGPRSPGDIRDALGGLRFAPTYWPRFLAVELRLDPDDGDARRWCGRYLKWRADRRIWLQNARLASRRPWIVGGGERTVAKYLGYARNAHAHAMMAQRRLRKMGGVF